MQGYRRFGSLNRLQDPCKRQRDLRPVRLAPVAVQVAAVQHLSGSGTRSKQALELVRTRPGISIPEMAEEMGIQQNYLYRVLPGLEQDGMVRKEGRGWFPKEAA